MPGTDLRDFTDLVFAGLTRADQRRHASAYLAAVLATDGKKSLRRLAAAVPTASPQALHQFLSGSPWQWDPVRREIARWACGHVTPQAWVLAPVVQAKRGDHSVGVQRWCLPTPGRTVNGQLSLGLFLSGHRQHVPIDWQLILPKRWRVEERLRRRAKIPVTADWPSVPLPRQLTEQVGRSLPVVADLTAVPRELDLLPDLIDLGSGFVVGVAGEQLLRLPGRNDMNPAAQILPSASQVAQPTVSVISAGHQQPVRLASAPVDLATPNGPAGPAVACRLLTELPADGRTPQRWWLTDLNRRPNEILGLARRTTAVRVVVRQMRRDFGLMDFEGRSYPGWHHHMTLVSAACVWQLLGGRPAPARAVSSNAAMRGA